MVKTATTRLTRFGHVTIVFLFTVLLNTGSFAQTSQIIPWNDGNLDEASVSVTAYHPEPIIFVHGITASRVKWEGVISNLHELGWFEPYHYVLQAVTNAYESSATHNDDYGAGDLGLLFPAKEKNQWREIEEPYLHTFNYGRHAKRLPDGTTRAWTRVKVSRQSHDLVETNSWQAPASLGSAHHTPHCPVVALKRPLLDAELPARYYRLVQFTEG